MPIFGLCMPIFGLCMPIFIIVVFICFGGFVCLFYLQFYTEERRMLFFYLTDFLHTHTHTRTYTHTHTVPTSMSYTVRTLCKTLK